MASSVIGADGHVRIPPDVRREAGLKPGQRVRWVPKGNTVVLVPLLSITDLRGIAEGADTSDYRDDDAP